MKGLKVCNRLVDARGGGDGQWVKVTKRHKLLIIREVSTGDVMHSVTTKVNSTVAYIRKLLRE